MIASPLEIGSCFLWLDASDLSTMGQLSSDTPGNVAHGNSVGVWTNKAVVNSGGLPGDPYYAFYTPDYIRPTYNATLSCVQFSTAGTPDSMRAVIDTVPFTPGSRSFFMYARITSGVDATSRIFVEAGSGALSGQYAPFIYSNATTIWSFTYNVSGLAPGSNDSSQLTHTNTNFNRFYAIHTGSQYIIGANGNDTVYQNYNSQSRTYSTYTVLTAWLGGGYPTLTQGVAMEVLEIIGYQGSVTGAIKRQIEQYFAAKWEKTQSTYYSGRNVYAKQSGNWSDPNTWDLNYDAVAFPGIPTFGTTIPTSADTVHANGLTVTIDSNLKINTLRNFSPYQVGGSLSNIGTFILSDGYSLTANNVIGGATYAPALTLLPNTTTSFYGTINGATYIRAQQGAASLSGDRCTITFLSGTNIYASDSSQNHLNTVWLTNSNVIFDRTTLHGILTNFGGTVYNNCAVTTSACSVTALSCVVNPRTTSYSGAISNATLSAHKTSLLTVGPFTINGSNLNDNGTYGYETVRLTSSTLTADNIQIISRGFGTTSTTYPRQILYLDSSSSAYLTAVSLGDPLYHGVSIYNDGYVDLQVSQLKSTAQLTTIWNAGTMRIRTPYLISNQARLTNLITSTGYLTAETGEIIESNAFGFTPIRANRCVLALTGTNKYIKQAVNRVNSYISYWSPDSTFDFPAQTDVELGVTYNNNTMTGDVIIPPESTVYFGVPYGPLKSLTGTKSFNIDDFFSARIDVDTLPDSVATRIKNSITMEGLSCIMDAATIENFTTSYSLSHELATVDEGLSVTFALSTYNVANGVSVPYFITGISKNDVITGSLSGQFVTDNTRATTTIVISADNLTEGPETLTLSLYNGVSASVVINDTSY